MNRSFCGRLLAAVLSATLVLLPGCGKAQEARKSCSARIEMESLSDNVTLPIFQARHGDNTEDIDRLNEIVDDVRERYEKSLSDDTEQYTVVTEQTEGSRYLLTTMYITDDWVSLIGRSREERNIITLAYDQKKDFAITSTEALKSTGITGVQLSQRADEQLLKLQKTDKSYAGNLRSTEMQGFSLDENGKVDDIYMKLEIDTGKEEPENFFFHFDPEDSTLVPLTWPEGITQATVQTSRKPLSSLFRENVTGELF